MTEKRFKHLLNALGMQFICYDDKEILMGAFADADGVAHIVEILNELAEENEQLKKREEQLLSEIEDFQQLLTKNDNICYKQVIELIDVQIKNGEEAIEWGKNMNADYGAMGFHIEMLKKLKKELKE